jgi:uncharacterized protein YcgL (UPF0745 family)
VDNFSKIPLELTASHFTKTTVVIPDTLLADVRKIAATNKTTLRALVQEKGTYLAA